MSAGQDLGPLVEIHVRRLPVRIWALAQEHTDELLREFTLIAEQVRDEPDGPDARPVPVRLTRLVEEVTANYSGFTGEEEARLFRAAADGEGEIDLTYKVPAAVSAAARHLADLLDEADDYCRAGEHLLTLATPPELVRFRNWFLEEFIRQVDGAPPLPWPDYADA